MAHVNIEKSDKGKEYWSTREFLSQETKEAVAAASIVIVPDEEMREGVPTCFPSSTSEVVQFLSEELKSQPFEIAIEDEDYQELALHDVTLVVAGFLVARIAAPIVVNAVNKFLEKKFQDDSEKLNDANVKISLTIEERSGNDERIAKLTYEGPAVEFKKEMTQAIANEFPMIEQRANDDS